MDSNKNQRVKSGLLDNGNSPNAQVGRKMKRSTAVKFKRTALLAAGFASLGAYANEGPYVGLQFGANAPHDQTYAFGGSRTATPQPITPPELPEIPNSGDAAKYKYGLNVAGALVVGDQLAFHLFGMEVPIRPELEIGLRREGPKKAYLLQPQSGTPGMQTSVKGDRLSTTTGLFNVWFDPFRSWKIHPYFGGGAGFARSVLNNAPVDIASFNTTAVIVGPATGTQSSQSGSIKTDDTRPVYQFGGGVVWDITSKMSLAIDYRNLKTISAAKYYAYPTQRESFLHSGYHTQTLFASFRYYFIDPPKPPVEEAPTAPAVVEAPPVAPEPEPVAPPPPPAPKCKTPEAGEKVSLEGCGTGDHIVLRGVNFDTDKATLTANAKTLLDDVSGELQSHPAVKVDVEGHTDIRASAKHNQALSERRAASVRAYLIKSGIAADRIGSAGFGATRPIADNNTEEGRELNRRVELKIVDQITAPAAVAHKAAKKKAAVAAPAAEAPAEAAPAEAAPADAAPAADAVSQ